MCFLAQLSCSFLYDFNQGSRAQREGGRPEVRVGSELSEAPFSSSQKFVLLPHTQHSTGQVDFPCQSENVGTLVLTLKCKILRPHLGEDVGCGGQSPGRGSFKLRSRREKGSHERLKSKTNITHCRQPLTNHVWVPFVPTEQKKKMLFK